MEARVASVKGHRVTLWEKSKELGGSLKVAVITPFKEEIECLIHYLIRQMEISNVNIQLNKNATAEEVLKENPDCIIVATGSKQNIPKIKGIENVDVLLPIDLLTGKVDAGERVILIGGRLIGADLAEYLNEKGKRVTLLTRQRRIGSDIGISTRWVTLMRIRKSKIKVTKEVSCKGDKERRCPY
ncbi:MAG: FAD-dependent oxidoreductase [Thermodesulfobacteriota bacterium]|nr:FAD-dependent oxidoreductase [Thermodesulfobacteriota bacterium]